MERDNAMKLLPLILALLLAPAQQFQVGRRTYAQTSSVNNLAMVQVCYAYTVASSTTLQINIGTTGNCANGGTAANPSAGDLLFVYTGIAGSNPINTSVTCTDTLANTWTSVHDQTTQQSYCLSILSTGGADIVTATYATATVGAQISFEISGANASPLDGTPQVSSLASGTSWTLPSLTTANANDMVIGCAFPYPFAQPSFTAVSPFTIPFGEYAGGNNPTMACEEQIVTSTGSYAPQFTIGAANAGSGLTLAVKSS